MNGNDNMHIQVIYIRDIQANQYPKTKIIRGSVNNIEQKSLGKQQTTYQPSGDSQSCRRRQHEFIRTLS